MVNGGSTGASKLRIREYDGETEDPQLWLRHIVHVDLANGWSEGVCLRQAKASLVRAAELWFESLGGDAYESWDDCKVAIRQRFREDYFDERLEEELRTIRQRQGESVMAYAERFRYTHT